MMPGQISILLNPLQLIYLEKTVWVVWRTIVAYLESAIRTHIHVFFSVERSQLLLFGYTFYDWDFKFLIL